MIILSLDTTSRAGSAAVLRDGVVLAEWAGESELTHGQRLPGDVMRLLRSVDLRIQDVELFAVAVGPGSFTGLRVGIATIQGLAMARHRGVVPVSTLDALAHAAAAERAVVASWMDGGRGEVFAQACSRDTWQPLAAATAASPAETLAAWRDLPGIAEAVFVGDGAVGYAEAIRSALGTGVAVEAPPPLAGVIGRLAATAAASEVAPHALVPLYVRRPDAELARDRCADAPRPQGGR